MDTQEQQPPRRYIIGDTETAGLGKEKKAVEVALLEIDGVTLAPIREFSSLIDPQIPMNPEASALNGITDDMLKDAPTMEQLVQLKLGGGISGRTTLICHNVAFDEELLAPCFTHIERTVCTLFESRQAVRTSKNHKLQTLAEHYGFPVGDAHRALSDCYTTLHLLIKLVAITGRTLDQLAEAKVRDVHIQPWGKHSGKRIMDLPAAYMEWLLSLESLEPNHRRSVEKALALKL
jgi:DNA polymerase III epsilon subunit-like protein